MQDPQAVQTFTQTLTQTLTIVAVADGCLLTRVCGILTTLDILPRHLRSTVDTATNNVLIEIDISHTSPVKLDSLKRKLARLTLVESVSVGIEPAFDYWAGSR